MICVPCRHKEHDKCPGGTWCDCQHLEPQPTPEPTLTWLRQG